MIQIVDSQFIKSATKHSEYAETPYLEIAFAGKSNVGKSSFINALTGRRNIAKTSSTPGKTRLINFFDVRVIRYDDDKTRLGEGFFMLTDLPGYGYAKVSKTERESWKYMIDEYLATRSNLRLMFLLVDIRHSADPKDLVMKDLLVHKNIPFIIVATKADKIGHNAAESRRREFSKSFGVAQERIIAVSSVKKTGLDKVLRQLEEILF
ncbi:MAG: ribosome biogenesis GTP-binding protein YihA/YsxC [Candidatus Cloacimonadia bacterium]|jgi:GTP-binding protein